MKNNIQMNHLWLTPQFNLFVEGLCFPKIAVNNILLTEVDKEKQLIENNRDKVLEFIRTNGKTNLTEISQKFNFTAFETKLILNALENNKKIKIK